MSPSDAKLLEQLYQRLGGMTIDSPGALQWQLQLKQQQLRQDDGVCHARLKQLQL